MTGLLVVGAGGHGRVVAEAALLSRAWDRIAFVDDNASTDDSRLAFPLLGGSTPRPEWREDYPDVVVAIGRASLRLQLLSSYEAVGFHPARVTHPSSLVSPSAEVGTGSVVLAGAIIGTRARIGRGCIINTGASVDHDCAVGDGAHICPGVSIAGDVQIGTNVWIGIGACVSHGLKVGDNATIGAGGAVVRDIEGGATAVGVPAKTIETRKGR